MTEPERRIARRLIDAARRQRVALPDGRCRETGRSFAYAYRALGCRCRDCMDAQNAERARRKRGLLRGEAQPRQEHGERAFKLNRCRCDVCRLAANEARRRRYWAAKARAAA